MEFRQQGNKHFLGKSVYVLCYMHGSKYTFISILSSCVCAFLNKKIIFHIARENIKKIFRFLVAEILQQE